METTPAWITYPDWLLSFVLYGAISLQLLFIVGNAVRPKYRRLHGWSALVVAFRNSLVPVLPTQLYLWVALIALLAPWWWLSVLAVHLIESHTAADSFARVSPTAMFVGGLAVFYMLWWLRGVYGLHRERKFDHLADSDEQPPAVRKRVAVIGAGMAGLVATKELKEEGHEVVVFEKTNGWGGVWASSKQKGGVAWGSTATSTGALNTTFSDCPVSVYHPENGDTPSHYTRQQFYDMLATYEQRYRVFEGSLRYHTRVVDMQPLPGERWRLTVEDVASEQTSEEEFDAVTICTGLNHDAWRPTIAGQGTFSGPEIHVEEYDSARPEVYAGKRVLVLGTGETSADLTKELLDHGAAHVYVSHRGPTMTLPRNYTTLPPDHTENRMTYSGPMCHRWGILLTSSTVMLGNHVRPTRVAPPRARFWFQLLRPHNLLRAFPSIVANINTTKSDNLWWALHTEKATLVPQVQQINESGAVVNGGRQIDVDAIIYCTGYRTRTSFLPQKSNPEQASQAKPMSARDLYKLTIHPDHPTVAVIGFARGLIGAITVSTELQARWWALVISGKRQLPEPVAMNRHMRYLRRKSRKFGQPSRTTMTFANSIARHEIGCEPDMFELFFKDRVLWFRIWTGAICNAHYRLYGVHAKPELAREQLMMPYAFQDPEYVDSVDIIFAAIPLSLLVIPLWSVVSALLPTFSLETALRSYV